VSRELQVKEAACITAALQVQKLWIEIHVETLQNSTRITNPGLNDRSDNCSSNWQRKKAKANCRYRGDG
jgi:hypothetical protein